jgi:hypothetical protein
MPAQRRPAGDVDGVTFVQLAPFHVHVSVSAPLAQPFVVQLTPEKITVLPLCAS